MQVRLEQDIAHNYLVPEVKTRYVKEDYQVHMLMENQIPGLLKMQVHHMDGMKEFFYDITSKKALTGIYETEYMKESDILHLIKGLHDVIHATEKYLLSVDHIVLDPSCIYIDEQNQMPWFCYLPDYEEPLKDAFLCLAEYILHHLDQNDAKAVLAGYELYRQAAQKNDSLEAVFHRILDMKKDTAKETQDIPVYQRTSASSEVSHPVEEDNKTRQKKRKPDKKRIEKPVKTEKKRKTTKRDKTDKERAKDSFGIIVIIGVMLLGVAILMQMNYLTTTQGGGIAFLIVGIFGIVLSEQKKDGKEVPEQNEIRREPLKKKQKTQEEEETEDSFSTTLLWEGEEEYVPRLSLIGMNSRDRITVILQEDNYLVGKQKSKVDICIDDPAVSRIHARITKEGEFYYVSDMNSTNGTFHNGRRLEAGEKAKLELTDEVTFADSGFYVGNC